MGMALGSLIHPDANTSVFSQVAVLWNPSLLRGASLEFHGPWGFPVLFTVIGNQVTQPGPLYLDPY